MGQVVQHLAVGGDNAALAVGDVPAGAEGLHENLAVADQSDANATAAYEGSPPSSAVLPGHSELSSATSNRRAYFRSVATSFVFSALVTFVGLAVALLLASLANAKIRGLAIYRTLLLWPYGIAPAVAGVIWMFVFHPSFGVLPYLLSFVTAYQFNWFLKGWVALVLIVVAAIWKQFGYNLAFYLAGLQAIPGSVLEAASVDGAGPIRRFFAITFPLLSPVTFFLFTLNMTFAFFETFGLVHSVTQGGPGDGSLGCLSARYLTVMLTASMAQCPDLRNGRGMGWAWPLTSTVRQRRV